MYKTVLSIILFIYIKNIRYLLIKEKYLIVLATNALFLMIPYFINNDNNKSLICAISTILVIIYMRIILIMKNKEILKNPRLFYKYMLIGKQEEYTKKRIIVKHE